MTIPWVGGYRLPVLPAHHYPATHGLGGVTFLVGAWNMGSLRLNILGACRLWVGTRCACHSLPFWEPTRLPYRWKGNIWVSGCLIILVGPTFPTTFIPGYQVLRGQEAFILSSGTLCSGAPLEQHLPALIHPPSARHSRRWVVWEQGAILQVGGLVLRQCLDRRLPGGWVPPAGADLGGQVPASPAYMPCLPPVYYCPTFFL